MSNQIKNGRFSAKVQSAINAFCASVQDANAALDKAAQSATGSIYREALDLVRTMKGENIVLSPEEAEEFRNDVLIAAGQGRASVIVGPAMSNMLRALCAPMEAYKKAYEANPNDLRKIAAACPKRGNGRPAGEKPAPTAPTRISPSGM